MARNAGIAVENNLSAGLVTEATALNFPTNAVIEADNCVFSPTSRVTRRLGFDYEASYSTATVTRAATTVIREYQWRSVRGNGSIDYTVVQVGDTLHFYEESDVNALSDGKKGFTIDLDTFFVSGASSLATLPCEFASGNNGYLFVFHPSCEPFYCVLDEAGTTLTATAITIMIRDMKGVDDGLEVDERPGGALGDNPAHHYNLLNQGWGTPVRTYNDGSSSVGSALTIWTIGRSDIPSNADAWWYYKVPADENPDAVGSFRVEEVNKWQIGNSPAPKGHFLLEAFNQDRSTVSGVAGIDTISTLHRPSCGAFFAGRVWYAGVNDQGFSGRIYFSQIIENDYQIGRCYQDNDPTSEKVNDLLSTDGGVVVIPEIGSVIKMIPIGTSLYIFASNGIWAISGSEGTGFRATDYAVRKISTVKTLSIYSFVDIEGFPIWWNQDAIYVLRNDESTGAASVESLTDTKIKTFFRDIPLSSKRYAKGVYDGANKKIIWLYNRSTVTTANNLNYGNALVFEFQSSAFYPWSIGSSTSSPKVNGAVYISGGAIKFLTTTPVSGSSYRMTFSETRDTTYYDWTTELDDNKIDYSSYLKTGYRIDGDAMRDFQSNYVSVFLENVEEPSLWLRGAWDFTNSGESSRWSSKQQVYNSRFFHDVQWRRIKIRGRGKALQLHFTSESGKPFTLLGWAIKETANADV